MIIEINTHSGPINGGLMSHIESELTRMHRLLPRFSRAEVHFRMHPEEMDDRKYECSISAEAYGNNFLTAVSHENWEKASEQALIITEKKVLEIIRTDKEPPDQYLSSVKV